MIRILSLGAGVQSSTLALMIKEGEFSDQPVAASVFADTGDEPEEVYRWLDWLEKELEGVLPVHRVSKGNLREDLTAALRGDKKRAATPPFFVRADASATSDRPYQGGRLWRQCTKEYKLEPLDKFCRAFLKAQGEAGKGAERWIGISLDEAHRMKDSRTSRWTNVYPLIDRRMTRHDCLMWLHRRGYPEPPKSACKMCPFKSIARHRQLRDTSPREWEELLAFDDLLRSGRKLPSVTGNLYIHRSFTPLRILDLSTAEERGQGDLFGEECDGMCGV